MSDGVQFLSVEDQETIVTKLREFRETLSTSSLFIANSEPPYTEVNFSEARFQHSCCLGHLENYMLIADVWVSRIIQPNYPFRSALEDWLAMVACHNDVNFIVARLYQCEDALLWASSLGNRSVKPPPTRHNRELFKKDRQERFLRLFPALVEQVHHYHRSNTEAVIELLREAEGTRSIPVRKKALADLEVALADRDDAEILLCNVLEFNRHLLLFTD